MSPFLPFIIFPTRQVSPATLFEELRHLGQYRAGFTNAAHMELNAAAYLHRLRLSGQISAAEHSQVIDRALFIIEQNGQQASREELLRLYDWLARGNRK